MLPRETKPMHVWKLLWRPILLKPTHNPARGLWDLRATFQRFEDAAWRKPPYFVMPPYFIHSSIHSFIHWLFTGHLIFVLRNQQWTRQRILSSHLSIFFLWRACNKEIIQSYLPFRFQYFMLPFLTTRGVFSVALFRLSGSSPKLIYSLSGLPLKQIIVSRNAKLEGICLVPKCPSLCRILVWFWGEWNVIVWELCLMRTPSCAIAGRGRGDHFMGLTASVMASTPDSGRSTLAWISTSITNLFMPMMSSSSSSSFFLNKLSNNFNFRANLVLLWFFPKTQVGKSVFQWVLIWFSPISWQAEYSCRKQGSWYQRELQTEQTTGTE